MLLLERPMALRLQEDPDKELSSADKKLIVKDENLEADARETTLGSNHTDDGVRNSLSSLKISPLDIGFDWELDDKFADLLSGYPINNPVAEIVPSNKSNEQPSIGTIKPGHGNHGPAQVSGIVINNYQF